MVVCPSPIMAMDLFNGMCGLLSGCVVMGRAFLEGSCLCGEVCVW